MRLQKIYTALLTADLAAAEAWYTKLLGRGPDHRPMDTLVQWELFAEGGLALSSDEEVAGRGVMFLYVDDVAAERRRLQKPGCLSAASGGPRELSVPALPGPARGWVTRDVTPGPAPSLQFWSSTPELHG
jgi:hypothetical protein